MKKAWQTTEFWTAVITNVVGLAVVFGAVTSDQGQELGKALQAIAGAAISIATTLGYIKARVEIKKARLQAIDEAWLNEGKATSPDDLAKKRENAVAVIKSLGV